MHTARTLILPLSLLLASIDVGSASAQSADNGQVTIVNPNATGNGILLYPGGQYGRVAQPLLEPGDPYPGTQTAPIHLHMPPRHVAHRAGPNPATALASAETPAASATPAPETTVPDTAMNLVPSQPTPPPAPKRVRVAKAMARPAAPETPPSTGPASSSPGAFYFGSEPVAASSAPGAPPTRMARATPPPAQTFPHPRESAGPGLTRQGTIVFAPGVADPAPDSLDAIKGLATPLNSALSSGAGRVQLVAYGGPRGDKSSDARRLSLKRALIIRQLLIDGGVPAERIDVRAMGGATDGNDSDRVDVFTKA